MSDYSIDGLIRYFQMAHKVMGWKSTDNSYEHHVAEMLKKLRDERDDARRLYCEYAAECDTPETVAEEMDWDCFRKSDERGCKWEWDGKAWIASDEDDCKESKPSGDQDYDKPLGGQWVDDGSGPEEEPLYDKYDGVLPGDLGTDRP